MSSFMQLCFTSPYPFAPSNMQVSKTTQVAHVLLVTSEYSMLDWLTGGGYIMLYLGSRT